MKPIPNDPIMPQWARRPPQLIAMARKSAADPARTRFTTLLAEHLAGGIRPGTAAGEPWTDAAFAAEVQSSREDSDFVSPRSVSNWRKGKSLPTEIEPILRALFGAVRGAGDQLHAAARKELREAYLAARNAAVIAEAKPDPAGATWVPQGDQLVIDRTARPSDELAATDKLRQQLQAAIRDMAAELIGPTDRLRNSPTWGTLSATVIAFHAAVDGDPLLMSERLGEAYARLLRLGRFLETDIRVQRDPVATDNPLDPDIHGLLTDVVRTAAPWLRGFPTVVAWDDEAGKALVRADLFQPAREFARVARRQEAISEQDAAEMELLADTADAKDYQGQKAGNRAVGGTKNLILGAAEISATARAGALPVNSPAQLRLVQRARATLAEAEAQIEAIAATMQADLRQALHALVEEARRPDRSAVADVPASPVPDDTAADRPAWDGLPSAAGQARLRERTLSFAQQYPITSFQGGSLTIEYTLGYTLMDRDRWVAQGSPHPEEVSKQQVIEATRTFLADKRFKDVITLYLLGAQGEAQLRDEITSRVASYISAVGVRLISTAVILSIPEKDFIEGRRLTLPTTAYSLADPNLAPPMKLSLLVRVASTMEAREAFARALTEHDAFEWRVNSAVRGAVRASLRRVGALQYYASHYVNAAPVSYSGAAPTEITADDPMTLRLRGDVDAELRTKFGLEVVLIDLEPGDADPLIDRMKALTKLAIPLPVAMKIGDETTRVWLEADGTIFIVSIDPENWSSFYSNAARIGSAEAHVAKIVDTLIHTLRMTQAAIGQPGLTDIRSADFRQLVVRAFTDRVRREFGLLVQLNPLMLRIKGPGGGDEQDRDTLRLIQ